MQFSKRVNKLRLSIGQDILYAISNGTLRTPKSILFPYMIKTLYGLCTTTRMQRGSLYNDDC